VLGDRTAAQPQEGKWGTGREGRGFPRCRQRSCGMGGPGIQVTMTTTISATPEETPPPKATNSGRSKSLKRLAIAAGALILAFLLGYIPSSISSHSTLQQSAQLEQKLEVAELGGQLAMASYEANRNNYANATQYSTQFFDGLPNVIAGVKDDTARQQLQAMLLRKAEITSNPAQVDETIKQKLSALYAEYFRISTDSRLFGK
jgi:hypothetical protein